MARSGDLGDFASFVSHMKELAIVSDSFISLKVQTRIDAFLSKKTSISSSSTPVISMTVSLSHSFTRAAL